MVSSSKLPVNLLRLAVRPFIRGAGRQSRPASGQAMVEFALSLGILLPFTFVILAIWGIFFASSTYHQGSQALTSWVSHAGAYTVGDCSDQTTSAMNCSIQRQLAGVYGLVGDGVYLYVTTTLPDGTSGPATGTDPASLIETVATPTAPGDSGWDTELRCLPVGTQVNTSIYGYREVTVPLLPMHHWRLVVGSAHSEVIRDGGEPC